MNLSTGRREVAGDGRHRQTDDVRHVRADARQDVAEYAECQQRHSAVDVFEARHELVEDLHSNRTGYNIDLSSWTAGHESPTHAMAIAGLGNSRYTAVARLTLNSY